MKDLTKNSKGIMKLIYFKQIGKERVKIKKIEDYYELFVRMLKTDTSVYRVRGIAHP